jgi:VAD1 Analog of StAR-related lipid transfer domain
MESSSQVREKVEGGGLIQGALDRISPGKEKRTKKAKKKSRQVTATPSTDGDAATSHRTFLGGALKNAADKVAQGSQDALRAVAAGTHKAAAALTPGGSSNNKIGSSEQQEDSKTISTAAASPLPLPHLEGVTLFDDDAVATVQTKDSRDETVEDTANEMPTQSAESNAFLPAAEGGSGAETLVIVGLAKADSEKGDGTSPTTSRVQGLVADAESALHHAVKPLLDTSKDVMLTVAHGSGDFLKAVVIQPVTRDMPQLEERISDKKRSQSDPSNEILGGSVDLSAVDDSSALPPDETLERMELLLSRKLRKVPIREWYEACWSEGSRTDRPPFYGPWLVSTGKKDVVVGEWEFGHESGGTDDLEHDLSQDQPSPFVNVWDQQEYQQRRTVTFRSDTNSAHVTHTQYCRVDRGEGPADDRCVVAFAVTMKGIPFADAFSVHIRWVATPTRAGNLMVQVGLFVEFAKQVLVAGKIRSNTTKQTTVAQLDLFRAMSEVLGCQEVQEEGQAKVAVARASQATSSEPGWLQPVQDLFRICLPATERKGATLELSKLRALIQKIQRLDPPPESCDSMYVLSELEAAHEALTSFLVGMIQGESGILSAAPAPTGVPRSPGPSTERNHLHVLLLDPIRRLVHLFGGSASTSDDVTVAISDSTDTAIPSPEPVPVSRSVVAQDEPANGLLSLIEDCLQRCWTKGSAWVDQDAELGQNVRWLDAKIRAAELLVANADEGASDSIAPRLAVASESLVHIVEWHSGHCH